MTSIKTAFATLALLLLVCTTSFANNNPITATSTTLRTELSKMVQNPGLVERNLKEASVIVQFSIDPTGQITVHKSLSDTPFLLDFIENNINGKKIKTTAFASNTNYVVRFKFKSE